MAAEAIPLINALLAAMGLTAAGSAKGKKYDVPEQVNKHASGALDAAAGLASKNPVKVVRGVKTMLTSGKAETPKEAIKEDELPEDMQKDLAEYINKDFAGFGGDPNNKDNKNNDDKNPPPPAKKPKETKLDRDLESYDDKLKAAKEARKRWGKEEYVPPEDKILRNRPSQGKLPHEIKPTDTLLENRPSELLPKHQGSPEVESLLEHKQLSPAEHSARELNYRIEHPSFHDRYSAEELANLLGKLTKHGGPKIKGILSFLGAGALASKGNKAEAEEMPEIDEEKALEVSKRSLKDLDEDQKEELFGNLEYIYNLIGSKDKADVELGRQMLEDLTKDYDLNLPIAEEPEKKESKKNKDSGVITGNITEDTDGIIRR